MELYVPIALRTVDCDVSVLHDEPPESLRPLRCVREVAKFNSLAGVEWILIPECQDCQAPRSRIVHHWRTP